MARSLAARWRTLRLAPDGFRKAAFTSLAGLYVVMITGAVVRLTGSGLGCANWPRCGATPFPERGFHAFVEFGNRVVALVAILLTVATAIAARHTPGLPRRTAWLAFAVAVGTILQIPLGGITVMLDLNPYAVMSHFLLALSMLGLGVVVALEANAFARGSTRSRVPRPLGWLSILLVPAAITLIVTGAFVTAAGPHPGDAGKDIPRLGNVVDAAHVHVVATAVFGACFAVCLATLLLLRDRARPELLLAAVVIVLLGAQMGVGEYQWNNALPWGAVLLHVALASAVWCGVVALVTRLVWAAGIRRPTLVRTAVPAARLP
jgi:cytochrome c oxidase assembly protein subunit 15